MISQNDLTAGYLAYKTSIDRALERVVASGWYILGREVDRFERDFANYVGVAHGVGVGSGTDAIEIALRACQIGAGDHVITVSHTAVATVAGIERSGANAVFVDIDPHTFTMSPDSLNAALTQWPRDIPPPKAVVPVHLYGQMADMEAIQAIATRHNLLIIEDCAQSHGATFQGRNAGSWGTAATFSFYPTKNLGALGDGGMVVTQDAALANQLRQQRQYGWDEQRSSQLPGVNSRLDELPAPILLEKLSGLSEDNRRRQTIAQTYEACLESLSLQAPMVRENSSHVYHQYVIRSDRRNELKAYLTDRGIGTAIHYPQAVHQQPAYLNRLQGSDQLSVTEQVVSSILSLPMYPQLDDDSLQTICQGLKDWSDS